MSTQQRWQLLLVILAAVAYLSLGLGAPRAGGTNPYHLSPAVIMFLGLTVVGLLLLTWFLGFYAWLRLDEYAHRLPGSTGRKTYGYMARGVWFLTAGLILSSLLSAARPLLAASPGWGAVVTQVNYYVIIGFAFLGFMWLRIGSRHLTVAAQAALSLRTKLVTVGPPVLLLAAFYVFLALTNAAPNTLVLLSGPLGALVLPINIFLVVGSWVLGLLAALNIERATHQGEGVHLVQPLVKLYNGILMVVGGFIILDALMSLGAPRLQMLPLGLIVLLLYGFIAVVALGFLMVGLGARELSRKTPPRAGARS